MRTVAVDDTSFVVSRAAVLLTEAGGVHSELGLAGTGAAPSIDGGECTHAETARQRATMTECFTA
jgi:hypothetical protein